MSAPLKLTPDDLTNLAHALERLTEITNDTGVKFCVYGGLAVEVGESTLTVQHVEGRYVVDDRIGD